ncbi:MAG: calcium-binding protein, partial [Gammaproteobacteria bacterium]
LEIDVITGTASEDVLLGDQEDNLIFGLDGGDVLDGAAGDDVLVGGLGNDIMTGGSGGDIFDFNEFDTSTPSGGTDHITDFNVDEDVLDLRDIIDLSGNDTISDWLDVTVVGSDTVVTITDLDAGNTHTIILDGVTNLGTVGTVDDLITANVILAPDDGTGIA